MQVFLETIISKRIEMILKNLCLYRTQPKPQGAFCPSASRRCIVPDASSDFSSLRANTSQTNYSVYTKTIWFLHCFFTCLWNIVYYAWILGSSCIL